MSLHYRPDGDPESTTRGAVSHLKYAMPTYVYAIINPDGSDGETFEQVQRMSEPPLATHPETGQPVRRVIQAPNLPLSWTDAASKSKLSDKNLSRLGFTKYQRAGDGRFEKTAGDGPKSISGD